MKLHTYAKSIGTLALGAMLLPMVTLAQDYGWFNNTVTAFGSVVSTLIPILIALAFLVFVWGLITFILASGDEAAKDEGKRRMIWGVLALFIITAIWGILALLRTVLGTTDTTNQVIPTWPIN